MKKPAGAKLGLAVNNRKKNQQTGTGLISVDAPLLLQ
jgi:hypothetical protein